MPLFDLTNIKIRAPIKGFSVPNEPTKLFDYDPSRLVVLIYMSVAGTVYPTIARTPNDVTVLGFVQGGYAYPIEIYGPDEIWITGTDTTVFVEWAGTWQAIYRV